MTKEDEHLAYFYCTKPSEGKPATEPGTVLRSILRQIAWISDNEVAQPIRDALKRNPAIISDENCMELIKLRVSESARTTVIVNALDEYENRQELLMSLVEIHDGCKERLQLLLTSQEHVKVDSKKWFPGCLTITEIAA